MKTRTYIDGKLCVIEDGQAPELETAGSLIARMEAEAGCRVDSNGFDNLAIAGLMGAMARALGTNPHGPECDIPAGILIQHQLSPAGQSQQKSDEALAELFRAGFAPLILGR